MHTALTGDLYQRDEGRAWIGGKLYVFGGDAQSDTGHVVHCVRTRWNVIDKRDAPGCALEHPNKGIPPVVLSGYGVASNARRADRRATREFRAWGVWRGP
jgi:hypothetical protein